MGHGESHDEGRAVSNTAPGRDFALVTFHDLTADRQSNARPLVGLTPVESLEDLEDPIELSLIKSDAIVHDFQLAPR